MSGQTKWTVVGGGKKGGNAVGTKEGKATGNAIGGLVESTGAFSLYSNLSTESESTTENTPSSQVGTHYKVENSGKHDLSSDKGSQSSSTKKKVVAKKTKTHSPKCNFDECVRELDPNTLRGFCKETCKKYQDNPQGLLKELAGHLQLLFADVDTEREFAFSNRPPGYPLSTLSSPCQEPLLSAIASCQPLSQETVFRYCLDNLLNEVKSGLPSYGTRIMLQLLTECNPNTCTECTQRIKILLQSSLNKVPEALSLLWVGLPHPLLHLSPAEEAWPELCLPLLYSTPSVPRQVLNFAIDYTCILLRQYNIGGGRDLFRTLPPTTLSALIASPQLTSRRTQTNIQEMISLLQTKLLACCSDEDITKYFTAVFKRLTEDKTPQVSVSFATECLSRSSSSIRAWGKLFPSLPISSHLLLKEFSCKEELLSKVPLYDLATTLRSIASRGSPEERSLAQGLLIQHKTLFRVSRSGGRAGGQVDKEQEGSWFSVCGIILIVLSALYLYFLSLLVIGLAKNGPGSYIQTMQQYLPVDKVSVSSATQTLWQATTAFIQFIQQLKEKLI